LELINEGDRRVSIEGIYPYLLMERQSAPDVQLKPVKTLALEEAAADNYVTVNNKGVKEAFYSWSLQLVAEQGKRQSFGPCTQDVASITRKSILGSRPEGDYRLKMIGQTKGDASVEKESNIHLILWNPANVKEGIKYNIISEFNKSKAITIYEKDLSDVITPEIPRGATAIIRGHADVIGEKVYNPYLSLAPANDVKNIIENGFSKTGTSDVKFELNGLREDAKLALLQTKLLKSVLTTEQL
jgi:hypothetical protein